jgi:hypothetical protein
VTGTPFDSNRFQRCAVYLHTHRCTDAGLQNAHGTRLVCPFKQCEKYISGRNLSGMSGSNLSGIRPVCTTRDTPPPPSIPISKRLTRFIPIDPQTLMLQTQALSETSPSDPHHLGLNSKRNGLPLRLNKLRVPHNRHAPTRHLNASSLARHAQTSSPALVTVLCDPLPDMGTCS